MEAARENHFSGPQQSCHDGNKLTWATMNSLTCIVHAQILISACSVGGLHNALACRPLRSVFCIWQQDSGAHTSHSRPKSSCYAPATSLPLVRRWTKESSLWPVFVYLWIFTSDPGPPKASVCEGMSPELMSPNPACMPAKDAACNYADGGPAA